MITNKKTTWVKNEVHAHLLEMSRQKNMSISDLVEDMFFITREYYTPEFKHKTDHKTILVNKLATE